MSASTYRKTALLLLLLSSATLLFSRSLLTGKEEQQGISREVMLQQVVETEKERVLRCAEKLLNEKPRTVTASASPRSAGGKHDFFSEGPYWWPDPAKPGGPYIQKDGYKNPDRFENHDNDLRYFTWVVGTHTSAYLLTGQEKYVKAAMEHLRAWFVDTATHMNPHLRYAQAIHGICTGRGIGIIDAVPLIDVAQSVMILEQSAYVSKKEIDAVKAWFGEFTTWITTDPYGIDEMNAKNNHGTWWHAQVAIYARLTGNQKVLDECKDHYKTLLLPNQMAADGSFPLELKRTKPYSYSLFNLDAMASLAWSLSDKSLDIWKFTLPDGRGMGKGLEFIYPYLRDKSTWKYGKDVAHWESQPEARLFMLYAALAGNDVRWFTMWKSLNEKNNSDESRIALPLKNPLLWIGLEKMTGRNGKQAGKKQ